VTNLLRHRVISLPTIVVAVLGWLAISNHCAIAAVEAAAEMPVLACHGTAPTPGKQDKPRDVECCKILRATLLTLTKNLAACDTLKFTAHAYLVGLAPRFDESAAIPRFEWDTGPPGLGSFAESVLQRSLLSHAPPASLS